MAFAGFFRMETLPALRCPSRRFLLYLFSCFIFFACAFYAFFVDSNSTIEPYKYVDVPEFKDEVEKRPPPPLAVFSSKLQNAAESAKHNSKSHKKVQLTSSTAVFNKSGKKVIDVPSPTPSVLRKAPVTYTVPDKSKSSISTHTKQKRAKPVQAKTKYIYIVNSTTSSLVSTSTSPSVVKDSEDTCRLSTHGSKLILLWTPFFDYWEYLPPSQFQKCPRCRNCQVTSDRSKLLESDAVIFHARDMSMVDMPPVRLPHQKWVFYCLESPPYSDFPGLHYTQNMFNWTMTYRSDSDIRATYGTVSKVKPPRKFDIQSLEWSWSNKSKSVAWMSSHCPTHGGRDDYVEELKKYIDVDIFGTCGTSICPPGETEKCFQDFAQKYKFFLAFENTICKDYITEKFYRTLKYNIIPVVFGGADYNKFSPPGSVIEALSFKSPKHLAFFLAGVGKNFKLYASFFKWRKNYSVDFSNMKECQLCSLLHKKDLRPSIYRNLREWWVQGSHCKIWNLK